MPQQRHIIKQQILDLRVGANVQAFELQNKLSTLYRSKIIPLIESYCNQLSDPDRIHRIDRLDLDLGTIDLQTLETEIVQKVADRLSVQLPEQLLSPAISRSCSTQSSGSNPKNSDTAVLTPSNKLDPISHSSHHPVGHAIDNHTVGERITDKGITGKRAAAKPTSLLEADFELIRDFLHTGRLPWWSEPLDQLALEERVAHLLAHSPERLKALLQHGLKQDTIRRRLLYQFSEQMRLEMLGLLVPIWHSTVHAYLKDIETLAPHVDCWRGIPITRLKQLIWQGILLQLSLSSNDLYSIKPSSKTDTNAVLCGNLLHIASQLQIDGRSNDGRSLVQHLLNAMETLQKAGIHLTSKLPHILTTLSQVTTPQATRLGIGTEPTSKTFSGELPSSNLKTPSESEWIESVNSLIRQVTELARFNPDSHHVPSLRSKIQALISRLNALNLTEHTGQSAVSDHSLTNVRIILPELDDLIATLEAQDVPLQAQQKIQRICSQLKSAAGAVANAYPLRAIASPISSSPSSQASLSQTSNRA